MATQQKTVDYLTDQIQNAGVIRSKKMFGEYAIYCDEKVVALVCDDMLYVKISEIGKTFLDATHEAPPYLGAKNYFRIPEEKWDDREWLTDLIRLTTTSLPMPKQKKKHLKTAREL